MKIIGSINNNEFIITATHTEVAKIIGYDSTYSLRDKKIELSIGMDVQVSPLWEALSVSRTRKADLEKMSAELRRVAGRVDTINQAIASPIVEVKQ